MQRAYFYSLFHKNSWFIEANFYQSRQDSIALSNNNGLTQLTVVSIWDIATTPRAYTQYTITLSVINTNLLKD